LLPSGIFWRRGKPNSDSSVLSHGGSAWHNI
jgi:hypothetical protein